MVNEQTVQSMTSIVSHVGDIQVTCKEALDAIFEADFETAEVKSKEAQTKVTEAHKMQTDAIRGEICGDGSEYSLLFAHTQDILMTIYNEINIAKQLLKIPSVYERRISVLENKSC